MGDEENSLIIGIVQEGGNGLLLPQELIEICPLQKHGHACAVSPKTLLHPLQGIHPLHAAGAKPLHATHHLHPGAEIAADNDQGDEAYEDRSIVFF